MYDYLSSFHRHPVYMRLHNILTAHGRGDAYLVEEGQQFGVPKDRRDKWDTVFSRVETNDDSAGPAGRIVADWSIPDRIYDIIVNHGMKPVVETHRIPYVARSHDPDAPLDWPEDLEAWQECIRLFTEHVTERYGRDEVAGWYFEVWNEPDGGSGFSRHPEHFMAMYDHMVAGVHAVDPAYQVGGPATMQGDEGFRFFEAFLEHCARGRNAGTGEIGTRCDFISVHCKGGTAKGLSPSTTVMFDCLRRYLDILKNYPEFRATPFFNDESDAVWSGHRGVEHANWLNFRNTHYFPGFVCKMVQRYCDLVEDEYGVNLALVDSDNCHQQWEYALFSGNRSQLTPIGTYPSTDLIRKPIFNAYVLLSRLGRERLRVTCDQAGMGEKFGVLATREGARLAVMVWNFEDGMDDEANTRTLKLQVAKPPLRGAARLVHYRIDRTHSNAYRLWHRAGRPAQPSLQLIREMREHQDLQLYEPVHAIQVGEALEWHVTLPMHAVSLLVAVPENSAPPAVPAWRNAVTEKGFHGNSQVFLSWRPNNEADFLHYRLRRDGEILRETPSFNTATHVDMSPRPGTPNCYQLQAVNASGCGSDWSEELCV
jgi:xylan 1,4-beta-xylosidase